MKLFIFLCAICISAISFAAEREECIFELNGEPQFITSIDILAPQTYGNQLDIYSIDGGTMRVFLGQTSAPHRGEKFRLDLVYNTNFTAFVLNETPSNTSEQLATLYLQSGQSSAGECKVMRR